jgi:hypothetical protein
MQITKEKKEESEEVRKAKWAALHQAWART